MVIAVVIGGGVFLAALGLVLLTVCHVLPETFKLKATATKWFSLDLEIRKPHQPLPGRESTNSRQLPPGQ